MLNREQSRQTDAPAVSTPTIDVQHQRVNAALTLTNVSPEDRTYLQSALIQKTSTHYRLRRDERVMRILGLRPEDLER